MSTNNDKLGQANLDAVISHWKRRALRAEAAADALAALVDEWERAAARKLTLNMTEPSSYKQLRNYIAELRERAQREQP